MSDFEKHDPKLEERVQELMDIFGLGEGTAEKTIVSADSDQDDFDEENQIAYSGNSGLNERVGELNEILQTGFYKEESEEPETENTHYRHRNYDCDMSR